MSALLITRTKTAFTRQFPLLARCVASSAGTPEDPIEARLRGKHRGVRTEDELTVSPPSGENLGSIQVNFGHQVARTRTIQNPRFSDMVGSNIAPRTLGKFKVRLTPKEYTSIFRSRRELSFELTNPPAFDSSHLPGSKEEFPDTTLTHTTTVRANTIGYIGRAIHILRTLSATVEGEPQNILQDELLFAIVIDQLVVDFNQSRLVPFPTNGLASLLIDGEKTRVPISGLGGGPLLVGTVFHPLVTEMKQEAL